jgi:hypothetical protein
VLKNTRLLQKVKLRFGNDQPVLRAVSSHQHLEHAGVAFFRPADAAIGAKHH